MKWNPITRRHFLQGLGGSALILPVLPSLLVKSALADPLPNQKTFIGIAFKQGTTQAAGPDALLLPRYVNMKDYPIPGKHTIHYKKLSDAVVDGGGQISMTLDSSFNPYINQMQILRGFDYTANYGHNDAQFGYHSPYTTADLQAYNLPPMATIDQVMAHSVNFYKNPSLLGRSIHWSGSLSQYGMSYTFQDPKNKMGNIIKTYEQSSALNVWNYFFSSTVTTPSAKRQTLVDQIYSDFRAVLNNPRLGSDDKQRIQEHVNFLQETERKVRALATTCSGGVAPTADQQDVQSTKGTLEVPASVLVKAHLQSFNDVIVSLIRCGLCHSFLGSIYGIEGYSESVWHTIAHAADTSTLAQINKGVLKDVALDLVQKLSGVLLSDGKTLLDNTLIAVAPEMSDPARHLGWNLPYFLFGSGGGALRQGYYIDYSNLATAATYPGNTPLGYPTVQILANFLQAMDVPPSEYEPLNRFDSPLTGRTGYGVQVVATDAYTRDWIYSSYGGWGNPYNASQWLPLITPNVTLT